MEKIGPKCFLSCYNMDATSVFFCFRWRFDELIMLTVSVLIFDEIIEDVVPYILVL